MEELIIIALIVGAGYYFLTQPAKEEANHPLTTTNQSTQTEPITNHDEKELEQTLDTLLKNIRQLNREIK